MHTQSTLKTEKTVIDMDYNAIFLGATAMACGALEADKGALAIGRGVLLAQEFCQGYVSPRLSEAKTPLGRDLQRELTARGLLENGRAHLPPVADVLARRLLEKGAHLYLDAETLDVRPVSGGFEVDVMAVDGLRTVTAERVIDTTSEGLWRCARQLSNYRKEARVPLLKTTGFLPELRGGVHIEYGPLPDEAILCVPLDRNAGWQDARFALRDAWRALYAENIGWELAAEPVEPAILYDAPVCAVLSRGWTFRPSVSCGDLMRAFEEGCLCV